ncbi:MAG: hypothetical protein IH931_04710 [candidate division Zixibacteria bacterium]|nr:hypothetical protein [candidate division Zixibacteria bacterium]
MANKSSKIAALILIISAFAWGCSGHFVTASDPASFSNNDVVVYFPLDESYQATFELTEVNRASEIIVFKIGKKIPFLEDSATQWISKIGSSVDTGFVVVSSSSLTIYESRNSAGEKILDIPLTVGKSWSRFSSIGAGSEDDFTIIITDNKLTNDTGSTGDSGVTNKSFPTDGSDEMVVDKFESIQLSNGDYYSNTVRISNGGSGSTRNYYWFAPGVGLVKYVIGSLDANDPTGNIEAELISHGFSY